ncbi:MAG: hypothetical protein E7672_06925 [Ruminococcaceae bacterium]|nr:hypothetical protein [Oscillospiraceae bacterium]
MSELFLKIFNMSISAGYIVLAVLLLRLLLKKAPKWISVIMWGIVAVRLVCPFSLESVLSLIPSAETVSPDIMMDRNPAIDTGIPVINDVINPVISASFTPDPATSANPLQLWIPTFALIWIVGMALLLVYTVISCARLKKKIGTAVLLTDNIYQSENAASPFVLGIIRPKIYIPFNMDKKDMEHVVAHETVHIKRKDHWWKPLGFLLLTVHWFNPLIWIAYILLCRDIELACDEKVISQLDSDARADYSEALLSCSVNRRMIAACPIAFGEVGVKARIKSVLNYKKPAFWLIIAAIIACVAVAVCFLTNPPTEDEGDEYISNSDGIDLSIKIKELYPDFYDLDGSREYDLYVCQFARYSYDFILEPHSDRLLGTFELMKKKFVRDSETMRKILSENGIDEDDVYIIPWQSIHSSYIADYFTGRVNESDNDKKYRKEEYIENIRNLLFDDERVIISSARTVENPEYRTIFEVLDYGCDIEDVEVKVDGTRYSSDLGLILNTVWRNKSDKAIEIPLEFKMYRYNGSTPIELENINPHWNTKATQVKAGEGWSYSYYLSDHYDVLEQGTYRFETEGVWIEFSVSFLAFIVEEVSSDAQNDFSEISEKLESLQKEAKTFKETTERPASTPIKSDETKEKISEVVEKFSEISERIETLQKEAKASKEIMDYPCIVQ